jgi:hypothetical protein
MIAFLGGEGGIGRDLVLSLSSERSGEFVVRVRAAAGAFALMVVACSSNESPTAGSADAEKVLPGNWGGEHAHLDVSDAGGRVEFDCAHGSLDAPLEVDTTGRFNVPGTLVLEGGPERIDQPPPRRSVRYAGRVSGPRMELFLVSDTGERLGSFTLELGKPALLLKCL